MKFNLNRNLALCLVIAATFLASCSAFPASITLPGQLINEQPAPSSMSGQEILNQSQTAMLNLNSFGLTLQTRINTGILGVTANGQGVYQAPDQFYLSAEALGQKFEIALNGSSGILVKLPGSSSWTQLTPDLAAQIGGNPDIRSYIKVAEYAGSPTLMGEETIDGVECYVIKFNVDTNKFFELNPTLSSVLDPNNTNGDGKVWVGKGDFIIRQLLLETATSVQETKVNTRTTLNFNSYNQPVVVPAPY
jgi:outer membrane lipoprotein-sorting protein